jgi:hypothetical protein
MSPEFTNEQDAQAAGLFGPDLGQPQMWWCTKCKAVRQWGVSFPENAKQKAFLLCEGKCQDVTVHRFSHVGSGVL